MAVWHGRYETRKKRIPGSFSLGMGAFFSPKLGKGYVKRNSLLSSAKTQKTASKRFRLLLLSTKK